VENSIFVEQRILEFELKIIGYIGGMVIVDYQVTGPAEIYTMPYYSTKEELYKEYQNKGG